MDKSKWHDGPWLHEPDYKKWVDEYTGYTCFIIRSQSSGCLCGYVTIKPDNYFYGKSICDINLDAHGGVTYAHPSDCMNIELPEEDFIVGFDCGHFRDLAPAYVELQYGKYRDFKFVEDNVISLAKQLKDIGTNREVVYLGKKVSDITHELKLLDSCLNVIIESLVKKGEKNDTN
jgi:hypothetical protein